MAPKDAQIKAALLAAVNAADDLTINSVREAAEQQLGLETGYFKSHPIWKEKSKEVIKAAVADKSTPSPAKATKVAPKSAPLASRKRKSEESAKPMKRRKSTPAMSDEEDELSAASAASELASKPATKTQSKQAESESELSDLIDEPRPKKVKRSKKADSKGPSTTKAANGKATPSTTGKEADLSPDEAEIKRLQGWLLKCGIRKLWHRELAPYDTDKARIKHLKGMLDEIGMSGRYSVEKASAIKERRELAAELEAVQEGNEAWGKDKDADSDQDGGPPKKESPARPVRQKPAASRFIDFGSDDEDD